uniref:Chemokine interleukin-8-like domain-containing protein n=1 Tax=Oryzias melastigma TaxID=30732 RepID=A0A3B3BRF8_ORYME
MWCRLILIPIVFLLPVERLASCCTSVSNEEITEPILGYMIQERNLPCVNAVIFQTNSGLYCSRLRAPWVFPKIKELRAKARSTISSSSASLLSIMTSTASSSFTRLSSSSSSESVTPSLPSLLSILTSTASPPSSSTRLSSSSSSESVTPSLPSLLSIMTSTASPPSSSTLLSSSSSSSPESVTPSEVSSSLPSLLSILPSTSSSSIYPDSAPTEQVDESLWDVLSSSASASTLADEDIPQTSSDETIS